MINVKEVIDGFRSFVEYVTRRLLTLIATFLVFDWALQGLVARQATSAASACSAQLQRWALSMGALDGLIGEENRKAALFAAFLFLTLGLLHLGYELLWLLGRLLPLRVVSRPHAVAGQFSETIVRVWRYYARVVELEDFVTMVVQRSNGLNAQRSGWWLSATNIARGWMSLAILLLFFAPGPLSNRADLGWVIAGCALMIVICIVLESRAYANHRGGAIMTVLTQLMRRPRRRRSHAWKRSCARVSFETESITDG